VALESYRIERPRYRATRVSSRKSTPAPRRVPGKLAPGHRLPQEQVAANQRERLLAAIIDVTHEYGYPAIKITDVLKRSSVSRTAFYELFDNREHCFLSAYDTQVAQAQAEILSAYRAPDLSGSERLAAALARLFELVVSWPAAARLCTSEIDTAGAIGSRLSHQTADLSAQALDVALSQISESTVAPAIASAIVGGLRHLIYSRVRDGREHELLDMTGDLIDWMSAYCSPHPIVDPPPRSPLPLAEALTLPALLSASASATAIEHADQRTQAHRAQILTGVAQVTAEKGYRAMGYRDIAAAAQISLTTFYNYFTSKQEAFLALFDIISGHYSQVVTRAFRGTPDPPAALRDAITALLQAVASDPAGARLATSEIFLTGRPGMQRVDNILQHVQTSLEYYLRSSSDKKGFVYELIVGAIGEIVRRNVIEDQLAELPQLAPMLSYIALVPLVGSDRARELAACPPANPA
jgi:AcrR family transcriptional regulator